MIPNPHVFREYDIRGVADRDFPDDFVELLGRALGTLWARRDARRVGLGRDCRLSSPRLHAAFTRGLLRAGLEILDIGMGPTPLLYFTVFHYDLDGGVQITGSHNPPEDNGFKMMSGKATLSGQDIAELRSMIERGDFVDRPGGRLVPTDPTPAYLGFVRGNIRLPDLSGRPLRFAIDAGSGAGGPLAVAAMRTLGLAPVALLCDPDGRFPVHHPDPSLPENLELLVNTVREQGLDFGIAYDGDADRIGVVDKHGNAVFGDKLLILLARDVIARRPGAAVLGEVKCSQILYDDIAAKGGRPILWKTGHSLIKRKMKEEHALLAGEMSGHVFFADRFFGFDDAVYASLRLIEILARTGKRVDELLSDLPVTSSTPELRVDCSDATKFDVVARVLAHYREVASRGEGHRVIDVDGARIVFPDGAWGLVRASNTQPVLVLRFEATSPERLAEIRAEVEARVSEARA
jgi:phosphomannomutase/phosphoglucomutase